MTKSGKHCGKTRNDLLVLSNFFFCHYVFKKPSATEASESVYMRERVNPFKHRRFRTPLLLMTFENNATMFSTFFKNNTFILARFSMISPPDAFKSHMQPICRMWERV